MRETTLFNFPSLSSLTITSKDDPFHKDPLKPIPIQHDTYTYSKKKSGKRIKWATFHRKLLSKVPFAKYQQQQYRPHRLSHYGVLQRRQIGTGASATVRMTHRIEDNGEMRVYAIKAFRKRKARETEASFMKKLISEFCISSALHHPNIVRTIDLVLDEKNRYCTVMEYCSGGDLYSFIKDGNPMPLEEANGLFKQLLEGLSYLHNLGVAHRDIKPENLLLTQDGGSTLLKITDFGEADVFREAWQDNSRLSDGLCGSTPYIAPEIFLRSRQGYRASQADVWSAAVVYFCMRLDGVPFFSAQPSDTNYRMYQKHFATETYPAFQVLEEDSRSMLYAMLNPDPEKRWTVQDILKLTWLSDVEIPHYII